MNLFHSGSFPGGSLFRRPMNRGDSDSGNISFEGMDDNFAATDDSLPRMVALNDSFASSTASTVKKQTQHSTSHADSDVSRRRRLQFASSCDVSANRSSRAAKAFDVAPLPPVQPVACNPPPRIAQHNPVHPTPQPPTPAPAAPPAPAHQREVLKLYCRC